MYYIDGALALHGGRQKQQFVTKYVFVLPEIDSGRHLVPKAVYNGQI